VASMKDQHGRVRRHAQGEGKPETESHFPLGGYEVGGGFALASDARAVQSTAQYADEHTSQNQSEPMHDIHGLIDQETKDWRHDKVVGGQSHQERRQQAGRVTGSWG
jgi:hypothetical protein